MKPLPQVILLPTTTDQLSDVAKQLVLDTYYTTHNLTF